MAAPALRFSTGLKSARASKKSELVVKQATTFSFQASTSQILDSGNGFLAAGFRVHDQVQVVGSAANDGEYTVSAVTDGALTLKDVTLTDAAAGASITLIAARGGSIAELLRGGCMRIYSGTRPNTANDAETGVLLAKLTHLAGAHNATTGENGMAFEYNSDNGATQLLSDVVLRGVFLANGTMGWARFYAQDAPTGASTTAIRCDCAIGTSSSTANIVRDSLVAVAGDTITLETIEFTEA